ncbi:guanine nucleotide binding protein, alpha subunit [Dactylonectria macrodidyma]|uniref:Guanine nucleotide binding protein, alpha subunit n=1 Tax=Dactylonectria macrodidyma TaxID=307937 RepID=A0A9P9J6A1_9HYPO|nr:guanine nucleotide binding protein, alpha subunit [Dactylonectria macrodidyma]
MPRHPTSSCPAGPKRPDSFESNLTKDELLGRSKAPATPDSSSINQSQVASPVWDSLSSFFTFVKQSVEPAWSASEGKQRSDGIDAWLDAEAVKAKRQLRIMLQGDGKQMEIFGKQARLISTPLSEEEETRLRIQVKESILGGIKEILYELLDEAQNEAQNETHEEHEEQHTNQTSHSVEKLREALEYHDLDDDGAITAQILWSVCQQPEFQTDFQQHGVALQKLGLDEQHPDFTCTCKADQTTLAQLKRVFDHHYTPTDHDWFHFDSRNHPGIRETQIERPTHTLSITDLSISMNRGRRSRWMHIFDDCTCIVFLADLAQYDENLGEDETPSKLHEALTVFESIANVPKFAHKPFLLVLTNVTVFKAKLDVSPLSKTFPDYAGQDAEEALEFLRNRFLQLDKREEGVHISVSDISNPVSLTQVLDDLETSVLKNVLENVDEAHSPSVDGGFD